MNLEEIRGLKPFFLQAAPGGLHNGRKQYVCPVCNKGGRTNSTDGIKYDKKSNRWNCFTCNKEYSTIDLYGFYYNKSDFKDQLQGVCDLYGVSYDEEDIRPKNNKKDAENVSTGLVEADYTEYFRQCNKQLDQTTYYRGISLETLNRFSVGYDANWKSPKALKEGKNPPTSQRLIIPTSKYSYIARNIKPAEEMTESEKQYKKMKEGKAHLFNIKAFNSNEPVFIVEGEIDAMSIEDAGGKAIGTGGTSGTNTLIEIIKDNKITTPLIIIPDEDGPGLNNLSKLEEELKKLKHVYIVYRLENYKDINEMYMQQPEKLKDLIKDAKSKLEEELNKEKDLFLKGINGQTYLLNLMLGKTNMDTPAQPTGFTNLDELLDGGLYEGLYCIGAVSSLGKTTLILQIASNIAESGRPVLFFSLEMSGNELTSKIVSRVSFEEALKIKNTSYAKTQRGISAKQRYKGYSQVEKEFLTKCEAVYGEYAKNLYIVESTDETGRIGINTIKDYVAKFIKYTGETPVVIVDYLQILAPADIRASDKQNIDTAVWELKGISREYKIPVIAISSFNRMSYKEEANMSAFKESGAIEYTSDVLIGLNLYGAGKGPGYDEKIAKEKNPREIELTILKNRTGRAGVTANFYYYPMFNYYEETKYFKEG